MPMGVALTSKSQFFKLSLIVRSKEMAQNLSKMSFSYVGAEVFSSPLSNCPMPGVRPFLRMLSLHDASNRRLE